MQLEARSTAGFRITAVHTRLTFFTQRPAICSGVVLYCIVVFSRLSHLPVQITPYPIAQTPLLTPAESTHES